MGLEEAVKFCEEHECEECPVIEYRSKYEKEVLQFPCCFNLIDKISGSPNIDKNFLNVLLEEKYEPK